MIQPTDHLQFLSRARPVSYLSRLKGAAEGCQKTKPTQSEVTVWEQTTGTDAFVGCCTGERIGAVGKVRLWRLGTQSMPPG